MDTALILETVKLVYKQNCILFVEHFHLETCASNIKAQNKLYKLYKIFWLLFTFQIKIAIEPGAFHYTFWCHDQLLILEVISGIHRTFFRTISGNSQDKFKGQFNSN